jgi:hypothetical protein
VRASFSAFVGCYVLQARSGATIRVSAMLKGSRELEAQLKARRVEMHR